MKNIYFYLTLTSLVAFLVTGCGKEKVVPKKPDPVAPVISEVEPVDSPTFDRTPIYTFSSTKEGKIDYRGGCSSSISWANAGTNTITFNELNYMTYSDCTIAVTDSDGVQSEVLEVSAFTVEMKPKPKKVEPKKQEPKKLEIKKDPEPLPDEPVLTETEPVPTPPEEVAEIEEAEIAIEKDADESVEAPKPMTIITAPPEEMESAVIEMGMVYFDYDKSNICLLYTSPSPRD